MSDINNLKQSFKGDIVTQPPVDADPEVLAHYKKAIARWAVNTEKNARVVAFVKDTEDVALALKYARDHHLEVASCGAGKHSPSGASSVEDGLVIDLSRHFSYAIADQEKRTIRVGGGTIWETVELEASKYEMAAVGGTVNHVRGIFPFFFFAVDLTNRYP